MLLIEKLDTIPHKEILGACTVIIVFIAYIPYFKDMFSGTTKPHIFSWLIWGINSSIIFFATQLDNAGPGSRATLCAGVISLVIAWRSYTHGGEKYITKTDKIFACMSFVAITLWFITDTPLWSVIMLSTSDIFAFLPTIRKSWKFPWSETLSLYILGCINFGIMFLALTNYSFITMLDIVLRIFINTLFVILILIRRYQVPKPIFP